MRGVRVSITALVCGFAMTAAAHAADPAGDWLPQIKKPIYTDLISGWYVRGDVGYRTYRLGTVEAPPPDQVTSSSIENTWVLGVGGGYKHGWLRTDLTLDYANKARFFGDTAAADAFYRTSITSVTVLVNAYADLGTWAGLTPYIGAGLGGANLRTLSFRTTAMDPRDGVHDNVTRWNLAWAAMAGVSYQLGPQMLLDVGYRYLNLGDAQSGTLPPAGNSDRVYFREVTAHELRVGLRWMLD